MNLRGALSAGLAVAWGAIGAVLVGTTSVIDTLQGIAGAGPAPSARTITGLVAWLAALVFGALAIVDTGSWLVRRRPRVSVRAPLVLLVVGGLLFATGVAVQLHSYRVCCAAPSTALPR